MKRGYLGSTEVDTVKYWTNGKGSHQLKCNETNLYALIDLCQENVALSESKEETQLQYSLMDKYFLCLKAIEFAGADNNALRIYGQIIARMEEEGNFDITFVSIEQENLFVDSLVDKLANGYAEETFNSEFMDWFEEVVVSYNYYQNLDGSRTMDAPKLNGLGEVYDDDYYSIKAKEGGMSMLYIACDKQNVLDGCVDKNEMMNKLLYQGQTFNWLTSCGTNMTKISVMANIKAGIKANSGYMTADETLDAFKIESEDEGKKAKGLGFGEVELITVIIIAVTVIVSLITTIVKARLAERTARIAELAANAPAADLVEQSAPQHRDFSPELEQMQDMLDQANEFNALDVLPIVGMGAIAVVAVLFAGKKKKND